MTYFGYPLDIHGWKTRPETEPDKFRSSEPENRGRKNQSKPKPARPETRGYPTRNRPIAILTPEPLVVISSHPQHHYHTRRRPLLPNLNVVYPNSHSLVALLFTSRARHTDLASYLITSTASSPYAPPAPLSLPSRPHHRACATQSSLVIVHRNHVVTPPPLHLIIVFAAPTPP
jgi:hypothetical protein